MKEDSDYEGARKLDTQQRIALAKEILRFRIIWDSKHPRYRKTQYRAIAWSQLASRQRLPAIVIRAEWKRMRDMYRKRLKKSSNDEVVHGDGELQSLLHKLFSDRKDSGGSEVVEEANVQKESDCEEPASKQKLTIQQRISLLEEIWNFEILWSSKHPDFYKTSCRNDAWNQIASRIGWDTAVVRNEYKVLRRMYRKQRSRSGFNGNAPNLQNSLYVMLERILSEVGKTATEESDDVTKPGAVTIEEPASVVLQCRLCLQWAPEVESGGMFHSISSPLAETICQCLGISVEVTDEVMEICSNCKSIVELVNEFRALCKQTNEIYDSVQVRSDIHSKALSNDWKNYSSNVKELTQLIRQQQELLVHQIQSMGYEEVLKPEHMSIKLEPTEVNLNEGTSGCRSGSEQSDFSNGKKPEEVKREIIEDETMEGVTKEVIGERLDVQYQIFELGNETKFPIKDTKPSVAGIGTLQNVPNQTSAELTSATIERESYSDTPAVTVADDPIENSSEEKMKGSRTKRFTKIERFEFAQVCLQYPNLWDINHPDYKDQFLRDETWNKISKQMRLPCSFLREQWSRLQSLYRNRNRRLANGFPEIDDYGLYQLCCKMMGDSGLLPLLKKDDKPKSLAGQLKRNRTRSITSIAKVVTKERETRASLNQETPDHGRTNDNEKDDGTKVPRPLIKPLRRREAEALATRRRKRLQHTVIYGICESCQPPCTSIIDRETRYRINKEYWQKTSSEQKRFIRENVIRSEVKKRRVYSAEHRVLYTYTYFLPDDQLMSKNICGAFFLNTIGYDKSSNNTISRAFRVNISGDTSNRATTEESISHCCCDGTLSRLSSKA